MVKSILSQQIYLSGGVNWRFLKLLDTYSHFLSLGILSGPLEANFSQNAFLNADFFYKAL